MSGKTNVATGSPNAQFVQAAGLFAQSMQRNSTLNRMVGTVPQGEAHVSAVLSKQTSTDMPIVRTVDLTRGKGSEVEFHFVQPTNAYPIMGSRMAEGKGTGIELDNGRVRVNQVRFPVDIGDTMTDMNSPVEFRRIGRPIALSLMNGYQDQLMLTHLAGARGFHDNIEWRLPTEAHPQFAEFAINEVKAPTRNRHFVADGDAIKTVAANAGELDIASTDVLGMDVVDSIRTTMESIPLPPPAIKIPEDKVAEDSPLRVLLVSPAQYHAFAQDPGFRQFQANALARASKANNHPLFLGEVGLWNGILICKMPKPIRFYAGDTVRVWLRESTVQGPEHQLFMAEGMDLGRLSRAAHGSHRKAVALQHQTPVARRGRHESDGSFALHSPARAIKTLVAPPWLMAVQPFRGNQRQLLWFPRAVDLVGEIGDLVQGGVQRIGGLTFLHRHMADLRALYFQQKPAAHRRFSHGLVQPGCHQFLAPKVGLHAVFGVGAEAVDQILERHISVLRTARSGWPPRRASWPRPCARRA